MSDFCNKKADDGASLASQRRGAVRRVPIYNNLPLDLPITRHEIHMVFQALGSKIATLFDEDE